MGYKSGFYFFSPLIKDLIKTTIDTKQWGIFFIYIGFFINMSIVQIFCLVFTGKTVSTSFKHYAQKDKVGATKVVNSLLDALKDIEEHMLARLNSKKKDKK